MKAAIYARVSTTGNQSVEMQLRDLREMAACWWRIPESRGYGYLIESATVLLPPVGGKA